MALKKSTPINLAALRQDYSMLPRIAAVKAKSSNQFFNAITSGLEKRKEKIEKKQLDDTAKKMIKPLLENPEFQKRFGTDVSVDEVLKLIGDPRKAIQLSENIIQATLAEEQLNRQIKQDRLANKVRKEQIRTSIANREQIIKDKESEKVFTNAIVNITANKDYVLPAEDAKKMSSDQLSSYFELKQDFTPDEIKILEKEGGARIVLRNGKYVAMYRIPEAADGKPTAAMSDLENRVKFFKEIENDFREGRTIDAIQKLNAIGARTIGGEMPTIEGKDQAMGLVGLLQEDLQGEMDNEPSDSNDKNSSKTTFTTKKGGVNVIVED